MKTIFITGSKGFIGTHIKNDLQNKFNIVDYDLVDGNDIRDRANLDRAIECCQPDVILHLGALAGVRRGEEYFNEYFSTNVLGTENVFALAKKHKVPKVISFSSSSVYNDNNQLKPISNYGRTKLLAEYIAKTYEGDIKSISIIRPFTVFGLNGRGDQVIYKWLNQIKKGQKISFYGSGDTYRPYTHISDLIKAINSIIANNNLSFDIFELGGNQSVLLNDLLEIFQKEFKNLSVEKMPLPKADSKGKVPHNSNWSKINYIPEANFKRQVIKIISEYKKQWKIK